MHTESILINVACLLPSSVLVLSDRIELRATSEPWNEKIFFFLPFLSITRVFLFFFVLSKNWIDACPFLLKHVLNYLFDLLNSRTLSSWLLQYARPEFSVINNFCIQCNQCIWDSHMTHWSRERKYKKRKRIYSKKKRNCTNIFNDMTGFN